MILLIAITVFVMVVVYWLTSSPLKWRRSGLKWLIPWPFMGNTFTAIHSTYYDFWHNFYRKFEGHKMIGFHLFSKPTILARDPAIIKQITMTEGNKFLSRGLISSEKDPFNRNLLLVHGEEWRTMRAKITPFLSPARIKDMYPLIEDSVNKLCQQMSHHCKQGPLDIDEMTIKMSTDIIVSSVFGLQSDAFTNPDSFIFNLQKELLGFFFGLRILVGFLSPAIYRALDLMMLSRSSTDKVIAFVRKVLDLRTKGVGVRPDFMQGMVDLYEKDSLTQEHEEFYPDGTRVARFNDKGVASQCMIMFAASTENIGRNLGFFFYEISMKQDIQDRLRKEIFDVRERNQGKLGYEQLPQLKYMDMVVSESLRKYPPVIAISRKSTTNTTIGNIKVNKGDLFAISIIGIHNDPKYYPDPDNFDPERFAPGIEREDGTYLPFGLGPKGCVGIRLTQVEIKLAISEVLSKFRLTPCSETPKHITFSFGPTLRSAIPIKVNATPIIAQV